MEIIIRYIAQGLLISMGIILVLLLIYSFHNTISTYYNDFKTRREANITAHYNKVYYHMFKKYNLSNKINRSELDYYAILNINKDRYISSKDILKIINYVYSKYDPDYRDSIINELLEED